MIDYLDIQKTNLYKLVKIVARKNSTRVTIEDVANHAGVSRSTVSLVIRGNTNISEKTREKVLKSIEELGYIYNRVAANLRSYHTTTVGIIITEIGNPFFAELLIGVHEALDQEGYTVILGTTFDSPEKQDALLSTMIEYRVGGIIMSPVPGSSAKIVEKLEQFDIPVVLIARKFNEGSFDYVGVNNIDGGKQAVKHLIHEGHNRIAFVGGFSNSSVWKDRFEGYHEALNQAGFALDHTLIFEGPASRKWGKDVVQRIMELESPPTAIFCYNDVVAFGVVSGLKEIGLVPGKDVAVVGFDNIPESALNNPSLTTIEAFPKQVGKYAAQLLHERMNNIGGSDKKKIIIPPKLIVRESS